jgi:hypothetical protein
MISSRVQGEKEETIRGRGAKVSTPGCEKGSSYQGSAGNVEAARSFTGRQRFAANA